MRIRHKPWAQPELDASSIYIRNPHDFYGKWKEAFENPELPLHLELGCGRGTFIAQKAVMVEDNDTPEILQRRVMEQAEWKILPQAIDLIANGKVEVVDNKVIISK